MGHRRSIASIVFAVSLILTSAAVAYGGNPHFRSATAALGSPRLVINLVEVGLGSGATVNYIASAHVTGTARCVNGGDNKPSASNKNFSGELASTSTTQADASGKVTAAIILPAVPPSFCPAGQTAVVTTATFTNVTLTDTTNGVVANIAGTFVYTAH